MFIYLFIYYNIYIIIYIYIYNYFPVWKIVDILIYVSVSACIRLCLYNLHKI